ncbi:MAG: hypothetical protein J6N19_07710 [Clostridium sp.]|nr:hypothetical protein [Clostridium sp.]
MKKALKIIGIIILVIVVLIAGGLFLLSKAPAAPKDYTKTVKTGGEIEARYRQKGLLKTGHFTAEADDVLKKHLVYYPAELESADRQFPVIFSLNGTGIAGSKYTAVLEHFASWGFIVLGNEDPSTGFGITADKMYDFLVSQNDDAKSPLFHKVDFDNIGLIGHSQGGAGVFSALSIVETSDQYKTGVALSPTHEEMAHAFTWMYDLESISVPVLMMAGTETEFETQSVIPIDKMNAMFDNLASDTKVMARRVGADHGNMLYSANGYAVAWFMWQLQSDEEAAKAFVGETPELLSNELYQDQQTNIH